MSLEPPHGVMQDGNLSPETRRWISELYKFINLPADAAGEVDITTAPADLSMFVILSQQPTGSDDLHTDTGIVYDSAQKILTLSGILQTDEIRETTLTNGVTIDGVLIKDGSITSDQIEYDQGGTGSVATTVESKLQEKVSVADFGATGDGVTDDSTSIANAHAAAVAAGVAIAYQDGKTYVCGNFENPSSLTIIGNNANWLIGGTTIPIPNKDQTTGEITFYVSTTGSDSANSGVTSSNPFATIQHAADSVPTNIKHRVVIQLADGTYSSGQGATDPLLSTPRDVRCYIAGFNISAREQLVIQGNSADKTAVVIEHNDLYSAFYIQSVRGVYIQDLTTSTNTTTAATVSIFAHRDAFVSVGDVTMNANDFAGSWGIIAETSAFVETSGDIDITNIERGIGCLEAVFSFIGSTFDHTSALTNSRAIEVSNGGHASFFSGTINTSAELYGFWCKDQSYLLVGGSGGACTSAARGVKAETGSVVTIRNITITNASRGVDAEGAQVTLDDVTITSPTAYGVEASVGSSVEIIEGAYTGATTANIYVRDSILTIDGNTAGTAITTSPRGVLAENATVAILDDVAITNQTAYAIDLINSSLRVLGTSSDELVISGTTSSSINAINSDISIRYADITVTASQIGIHAIASNIYNNGFLDIDSGATSVQLEQNASYQATSSDATTMTNATTGINATRGGQAYYRSSAHTFTGTSTATAAAAASYAAVTSF